MRVNAVPAAREDSMSLTSRINNPDRRSDEVQPLIERRNGDERRLPAWIRRKNEQGIARDETGRIAV